MASMHSARTHVLIIPTIAHWAISSAVHVLRLVSTANSRTERLCILLPASIMAICMYLFQSLLQFAGFPTKYTPPSNSSHIKTNSEKIVAAASDWRNTVVWLLLTVVSNCVLCFFPVLNRAPFWRIAVQDKSQCLQPRGATVQNCTIFFAICHPILDPLLCPGQNSSICQEVLLTNGSKVHYNMGTYDSNHVYNTLGRLVYFLK